ncbi:MAG: hypothetical protein AAFR88_03000 [Pseudomonadota bacterium]
MDKSWIWALIAFPLVLAFGGQGGGGGKCHFTKPGLVFSKACHNEECRAQIKQHLPRCQRRYASELTISIRHDDGVTRAPHLSRATMDTLAKCIASASTGAFDRQSLDLSAYRDVSKDVRGDTLKEIGAGFSVYPVVGKTTFLYGPA